MTKEDFNRLKEENKNITLNLLSLMNEDPLSDAVQKMIAKHYNIIRKFWGTDGSVDKQAEAYAGLGQLYVNDERYTSFDGKPNGFALFMSKAMSHYAKTNLE